MNISVQNYKITNRFHTNFANFQNNLHHKSSTNSLNRDVFIKNFNTVSFTANEEVNETTGLSTDDMKVLGFVGGGFLMSVALATYMAKDYSSDDILHCDGTYYKSVEDLQNHSGRVKVDEIQGSIKIPGTGINIKPDEYDVVDVERGIYKNYDKSVDIDLLNNKYIDKENGIFIDPVNKISAITTGEEVHSVVIPNFVNDLKFRGHSMQSGGSVPYSTAPTRAEFIEEHGGKKPEEVLQYHGANPGHYDQYSRYAFPDDNRDFMQKLKDFFNPGVYTGKGAILYDHSKSYDVFGREILTIKDSRGNITKVALDEDLAAIAKKHDISNENISEIAAFFDKIKMDKYFVDYKSGHMPFKCYGHEDFEHFKDRLLGHLDNVPEIEIPDDGDPETFAEAVRIVLDALSN